MTKNKTQTIEILNRLKGIGRSTFNEKEKVADQVLASVRKDLIIKIEEIEKLTFRGKIWVRYKEVINLIKKE